MATLTTLDRVKTALRITTDAYDDQLETLIAAAQADLGIAGVVVPSPLDEIVTVAICTYCRCNFGSPDDYDRIKKAYDEQKAQLSMATGWTSWTGAT